MEKHHSYLKLKVIFFCSLGWGGVDMHHFLARRSIGNNRDSDFGLVFLWLLLRSDAFPALQAAAWQPLAVSELQAEAKSFHGQTEQGAGALPALARVRGPRTGHTSSVFHSRISACTSCQGI